MEEEGVQFTDDELMAALRQIMPETKARELVRALREPVPEVPGQNTSGMNWTEDTLDLLSRVSEELADRVAEYRRTFRR